ncbi:MAG TPA: copper-binding protein [Pyrinomonadaceae bacterium]|nr:copper-binding protein [Pyrinomonadaceae bacterium]
MKIQKLTIIVLFAAIAIAAACSSAVETPKQANSASQAGAPSAGSQTFRSIGVVKTVDVAAGKVTVDHEDIPGYMAPMEMNEPVADAALLTQVKPGDKVEFEILREGSKIKYTKFNKIGEVALIDAPTIYAASCAECHGDKGQGGPKGIPFTSGHALDHTEADFIKTVTDGKSKKKDKEMPAFRDKLSPEEIAAVVKFFREVIQKDLKRNEGHKH